VPEESWDVRRHCDTWPPPRSDNDHVHVHGEFGYKYGFAAFAAALISGLVMIIVGRTGLVVARFRALKLMTCRSISNANTAADCGCCWRSRLQSAASSTGCVSSR